MIGPYMPPHFDNDGNGRIGDVIKATLQSCGHTVSLTIVPFGRHWKDYEDNKNNALLRSLWPMKFSVINTRITDS